MQKIENPVYVWHGLEFVRVEYNVPLFLVFVSHFQSANIYAYVDDGHLFRASDPNTIQLTETIYFKCFLLLSPYKT
jgi:hypothetical protein